MKHSRPTVAIVIDKMQGRPTGGSHAVGAWMAEALKGSYDVTIVTLDPDLTVRALNEYFGTSLGPEEVRIEHVSLPRVLLHTQKLWLLKKHLFFRHCFRVARDYDLAIDSSGEAHFGVKGIQYIHFPMASRESGGGPILGRVYEAICRRVSGYSLEKMRANLTLTNSHWTAEVIKRVYGVEARVLHPPVPDDYPAVAWDSRENGFLCVGRITPEKQLERVVKILKGVRERGWGIHLHIIGERQDRRYWRSLSGLLSQESSWVSVEGPLAREDLVAFLAGHKYGLHAMHREHFGIVIGEMVKAGCVVFVPRGGGQLEIVNDERLTYLDEVEAVDKICAILGSRELQSDLRAHLMGASVRFSVAEFTESVRRIARDFLESKLRASGRNPGSPAWGNSLNERFAK